MPELIANVAALEDGLPERPESWYDGEHECSVVRQQDYDYRRAKAQELQEQLEETRQHSIAAAFKHVDRVKELESALAAALERHQSIMKNHDEMFAEYITSNNSLHRQLDAALEREKAGRKDSERLDLLQSRLHGVDFDYGEQHDIVLVFGWPATTVCKDLRETIDRSVMSDDLDIGGKE